MLTLPKQDVPVMPNSISGDKSPFVGAVDGFHPLVGISGWAMSGADPDDIVRVDAVFGDELIGSTLATSIRPDISEALGRDAHSGFMLKWTEFDADAVFRLFEVADGTVRFLVGDRKYALVCVNGEIRLSEIAERLRKPGLSSSRELIAEIDASELFDDKYYRDRAKIDGDRLTAVKHYLAQGEKDGLRPSEGFDVEFYRQIYGKLVIEPVLLLDFIKHGMAERRYATWEALRADAKKIEESGVFDHAFYYEQLCGHFDPALTDVEQHLAYGWSRGMHANRGFDDRFYFRMYDDVRDSGLVPLVHYVERGRRDWRMTDEAAFKEAYEMVSGALDDNYYRAMCPGLAADEDLVKHYLLVGLRTGLQPRKDFSPEYYQRRHPDIGNVEPFSHFLRWGQREGRAPRANFAANYLPGKKAYDPSRKTLLLVSHDGSRTGAPLVSYALGEAFCGDRNIVHMVLRHGPLVDGLAECSVAVVVADPDHLDTQYLLSEIRARWNIEAVILSSVETVGIAEAALEAGVATVALVHEFPEYCVPRGKVARMVATADFVVTPAKLLEEAAQQEVLRYTGARANNIRVHPQGHLGRLPDMASGELLDESEIYAQIGASDGERPHIVLGAGAVQIRKGVDLFVQTAAYVRERCKADVRFIWVGSGYEPETDIAFSIWVGESVERLGLQDVVHFLPEQSNLDTLFGLCDIFYLPSRLDPFPNVVIDAVMQDKPVVAFRNATGVAEHIESGDIDGRIVRYLDVSAAADAITAMLKSPVRSGRTATASKDRFDFGPYASFIEDLVDQAVTSRREQIAVAERIEVSGAFDSDFYEGRKVDRFDTRRVILDYVSRAVKGLSLANPRPGFHDGLYRSMHALEGSIPLDHALTNAAGADAAPETHKVTILDPDYESSSSTVRVALHLHLHYSELAFAFEQRLSALERDIDVFITTTSSEKELEARYAFAKYKRGQVDVTVVPNRGRDIGPLLTQLHEPILAGQYDVVGHLHGKKTAHVKGDVGGRWREYLLTNLCGATATFDQLADLFMTNSKLGLVFAEDRHLVGWYKNREIAEELASRITPRPKLPAHPYFPLGTMFWARPAALQPLWELKLDWSDYPAEPLDEDGTVLHAIERMLPSICEAAGFEWMTVYRKGTGW